MKKVLLNISACALSFIVVLTSIFFTIDKHYCGEILVDISYFGVADNCGMDGMKSSKKKKKCCKNETEIIKLSAFDKENLIQSSTQEIQFPIHHANTHINLFQEVELEKEFCKKYPPPDIVQDIQVLYEIFLI